MFRRITKKRAIVALTVVAALAVAGGAIAYFTAGGTGTGSASVGSASNVKVNQTSSISGLYPGATPVALSGNFDNTGSGPVNIGSVTAVVSGVTALAGNDHATNGKPDCTTNDFEIGGTSNNPGSIPTGTSVGAWNNLTVDMKETGANQDNCQGASIQITYTAHAAS
jgi:hypothetical protein